MRALKLIILALLATTIGLMSFALPVYAAIAEPDDTPEIITKKCYRNLLETGDFLIVWEANVPYGTTPDDPISDTFIWELISTDGVTVLGSTTGWPYQDAGYNYQCLSMYFDADEAIAWQPDLNYTLRLSGNPIAFADPPIYSYSVISSEYSSISETETARLELAADIILIASDLDLQWDLSTSLVSDDETGQVLSIFGQAYFRGAIYGLQSLAPALFALAFSDIDLEDRVWTDSYVATLDAQYEQTWVETAKQGGADMWGVDFDLISIIILIVLVIGIFIGNTMLTNNHWNGAIDVAFILVITAKLGYYGLEYLGLIAAVCVIYLGMRLFKFPH